jgi:site-specific DNA-methyltransferase (adenine-specific)
MRKTDRALSLQLGITYVRAGESKGSLLVKQGFEHIRYICLHTNGNEPVLYKQTNRGFQIWTAKALRDKGFTAENAPYYAVFLFDPKKPVLFDQPIDLHKKKYTQVAHIQPLSDFMGLK